MAPSWNKMLAQAHQAKASLFVHPQARAMTSQPRARGKNEMLEPKKTVERAKLVPVDTFARVGTKNAPRSSAQFMDEVTRLHSTTECAYQVPNRVREAPVLEFSAALEANHRRCRSSASQRAKRVSKHKIETIASIRHIDDKIERLGRTKNKANLRLSYLESAFRKIPIDH